MEEVESFLSSNKDFDTTKALELSLHYSLLRPFLIVLLFAYHHLFFPLFYIILSL